MKLIIDIPEEVKHKVYAYGLSLSPSDKEQLINAIMNGIPIPDNATVCDIKAIQAEKTMLAIDKDIIAKENKRLSNVIEQIKAEIDRQQKWLLHAGYTVYNVDIALDAIKSVVAESENMA